MKPAEEIFLSMIEEMPFELVGKNHISKYIIEAIQQAQSEAIDEIVQRCSDRVPLSGLEFYLAGHDLKKELGL